MSRPTIQEWEAAWAAVVAAKEAGDRRAERAARAAYDAMSARHVAPRSVAAPVGGIWSEVG